MPFTCPLWVYKQFSNPTKITVHIFKTLAQKRIYAIPHMWINDPQGRNRCYLGWYDHNGNWLYQTLNDQRVIANMNLVYLGKCVPQTHCHRPSWVRRLYPHYTGRVDLYWHKIYGFVYTIDEGEADGPRRWFTRKGEQLYVSPVYGWGKYPQSVIDNDRTWSRNVKYIGMCTAC